MSKTYYFKNFMYSAIFWIFVLTLLTLSSQNGSGHVLYFISFGAVSTLFYPLGIDFISQPFPALMKPTHWGRWVGFMALVFAVPLGICWLVRHGISRG